MDDLIPILIFVFIIFGGALKNILKKLSDSGKKRESGENQTLTGQLRDLLQDEDDEEATPSRPEAPKLPPRPTARPLTQPATRTQPPRPTVQPARPTVQSAPRPVPSPVPQPVARQARSVPSAEPVAKTPRPQPVLARAKMPAAKPPARQTPRVQRKVKVALPTHKRIDKITTGRTAGRQSLTQGRSVAMRLNRKTLGAAMVISEIINPPLALRKQRAPWED